MHLIKTLFISPVFSPYSGCRSLHGSVQSLASKRDSLKTTPLPDLPPKVSERNRSDTGTTNGYQRPGSM